MTGPSFSMPNSSQNLLVSVAAEQNYHYIRDDELDRIGEMSEDPVMEMCLLFGGAFLGTILPAIEQLARFNDQTNPMGWVGLVTIGLAAASLCASATTGYLWYSKSCRRKSVIEEIRSRPKIPVHLVSDNG